MTVFGSVSAWPVDNKTVYWSSNSYCFDDVEFSSASEYFRDRQEHGYPRDWLDIRIHEDEMERLRAKAQAVYFLPVSSLN